MKKIRKCPIPSPREFYELRLFTVSEFHRMVESDLFEPKERLELIEGEIINQPRVRRIHADIVDRMNGRLHDLLDQRIIVQVRNPVVLNQYCEPVPDLALLKPTPDLYQGVPPNFRDVLWVVEIGEKEIDFDRDVKGAIYARANIKEYWLINIPDRCVEVYRRPSQKGYRLKKVHGINDTLTFVAFPKIQLAVKEVFGA